MHNNEPSAHGTQASQVRLVLLVLLQACALLCRPSYNPTRTRAAAIPPDAVKMTPATDSFPPVLRSDSWEAPVPMEGPVNTAGAEDSPFITPDGDTFFFFFTPDVRVPVEKQLLDSVTGTWWTTRTNGTWSEPEHVILNDDIGLDGAAFYQHETLWFATVRVGTYRKDGDIYTALLRNGTWTDWRSSGEQLNVDYQIGEMHITADGRTLYFAKRDPDSTMGMDLWKCEKNDDGWSEPVNLGTGVNTTKDENQPFVSEDGRELWFTRMPTDSFQGPSVVRCIKQANGEWGPPQEIISQFAGEPTLDRSGNIHFVHHYFYPGRMIEADIYVARRRP